MPNRFIIQIMILAAIPIVPCMAQEMLYGPLPTVEHSSTTIQVTRTPAASASTTEVVAVPNEVNFKFKERLENLQTQIDNGLQKGWLAVGQAAAFSTERSRLLSTTNDCEAAGWPKDQTDRLEKDVTAFSASVTSAMSKESAATQVITK